MELAHVVDVSAFDPKAPARVPVLRNCGDSRLNPFDRVVDITAAFEFYGLTYAVWGSLLNYIHGAPVVFSETSFVIEDDDFDLAVEILLSDDYMRQCFCTRPPQPLADTLSSSVAQPIDHIGFHERAEAHFLDRDALATPVQLWKRSRWFPDINILQEGISEMYFPYRERQELTMRGEDAPYLLNAISPSRPRAFRVFTPAQLIESALVHGASCLPSDRMKSISWARTLFDALLYIGEARGRFQHPAVAELYNRWLINPIRASSSVYLELVSQALSEEKAGPMEPNGAL